MLSRLGWAEVSIASDGSPPCPPGRTMSLLKLGLPPAELAAEAVASTMPAPSSAARHTMRFMGSPCVGSVVGDRGLGRGRDRLNGLIGQSVAVGREVHVDLQRSDPRS